MKFGCCTTMEYYDLLDKLGYDYIEIQGAKVAQMPEEELEETARRLKEGRVKCCGFNVAIPADLAIIGPNYSQERTQAYAKELCRRGSLLGIQNIGIGSPNSRKLPEGYDKELAWKQAGEFVTTFAKEAQPYGINILWEALNHLECNFSLSIPEAVEFVKGLDLPNVFMVGDLYHMALEQEGAKELLEALPLLRHVHLAQRDKDGNRGYPDMAHLEEYRQVLQPVLDAGYDLTLSAEAFYGPVPEGAEEAIRVFRALVG